MLLLWGLGILTGGYGWRGPLGKIPSFTYLWSRMASILDKIPNMEGGGVVGGGMGGGMGGRRGGGLGGVVGGVIGHAKGN